MRPVQVAYQSMQQLPAGTGQPFVSAAKPSVFRLEVVNVPQYLNSEEFRAQFLKLDGCVEAVVDKDDARQYAAYFIGFNTQEFAETCIASFTQWKGWGPKGLAFRRIGFVVPSLSRLPSAEGGGVQPAKQSHIVPSATVKHSRESSAYVPGVTLGPSSVQSAVDQTAAMSQQALQGLPLQAAGTHTPSATVMYQSANGSLFVPGPGQGETLVPTIPPPSGVGSFPMQHPQSGPDNTPTMMAYRQNDAASSAWKPDLESTQHGQAGGLAGINGIASSAPSIQYVRLADGSLKAMMAVTGNEQPQHVSMLDQHGQPSHVASQAFGTPQASVAMHQGLPRGKRHQVQHSEPVLLSAPVMHCNIHTAAQTTMNSFEQSLGSAHSQYMPQQNDAANISGVAIARSNGVAAPPVDAAPSNDGPSELPANASQTLYVDDVPLDMQKRELCHIFRPFGGFKEVRIVAKTTKEGRPYSFAFAQFETAECAAAALGCLNGYQYDPDKPELGAMQLKYARQERGKGGGLRSGYDDMRMSNRPRLMRVDLYDSNEVSYSGRFRKQTDDPKRPRQHY